MAASNIHYSWPPSSTYRHGGPTGLVEGEGRDLDGQRRGTPFPVVARPRPDRQTQPLADDGRHPGGDVTWKSVKSKKGLVLIILVIVFTHKI